MTVLSLLTLALSLLVAPLAAHAQPAGKLPRLGVLAPGPPREEPIDFQRKFRERLCRLVHFPELFTVASHEHRDFTGGLGKMQQGSVHFLL